MKNMLFEEYAVKIISQHLKRFSQQFNGLRKGKDIEYLHRIRVASRRLRTSLQIFKSVFPAKKLSKWTENIRAFAKASGNARDLDVLIAYLRQFKKRIRISAQCTNIQKLINSLQEQRGFLQPKVLRALDKLERSLTHRKIEDRLSLLLSKKKMKQHAKLYTLGEKHISKRLKKLLLFESCVTQPGNVEELHKMRIAAKHLRYTSENFRALYGEQIEPYIEIVHTVQDFLGKIHDFDVWITVLPITFLKEKNQEIAAGVKYFISRCRRQRTRTYKQFVEYWETMKNNKTWEQFREIITTVKSEE